MAARPVQRAMSPIRLRRAVVAACLVALLPVSVLFGVADFAFDYPSDAGQRLDEVANATARARIVGGLFILTQVLMLAAIPAVLALAPARGAWPATIGSGLLAIGVVGHAGGGGAQLLRVTMAESPDRSAMVALAEAMDASAADTAVAAAGLLGFLLGSILLAVALLRARTVPLWVPIMLLAGLVVEFALSFLPFGSLAGLALFGAGLAALGLTYRAQTGATDAAALGAPSEHP